MGKPEVSRLTIQVQPGAKRNEIVSISEDAIIKIKIIAPPVEGKANEALLEHLRKVLEVKKSQIEIVFGEKSRTKVVQITGMDLKQILTKIGEYIS